MFWFLDVRGKRLRLLKEKLHSALPRNVKNDRIKISLSVLGLLVLLVWQTRLGVLIISNISVVAFVTKTKNRLSRSLADSFQS